MRYASGVLDGDPSQVGGKPWEPGDPGAGEYPLSHGAWHAIRRECGLPDDGY